jgi:hypothetical protein
VKALFLLAATASSITFSGDRSFRTDANKIPWDGQQTASIHFKIRCNATSSSSVLLRDAGNSFAIWLEPASSPNSTLLKLNTENAAQQHSSAVQTLTNGVVYTIGITYEQGRQTLWVDGVPTVFGNLTGATQSWPVSLILGHGTGNFTLDDVGIWNGYVLTQADVIALRDGTSTPAQIGEGATWRGEWTLAGTSGQNASPGDPGQSTTGCSFTSVSGTGTAVYAAPLIFSPPVNVQTAYIATSGKTVGISFRTTSGASTTPTAILTPPSLTINGGTPVALATSWVTGYHSRCLLLLPAGISLAATDTATLSAPTGWANTSAGICGPVNLMLSNFVGKSAVGTDTLKKTFRPGWNFPHLGAINWSTYQLPKNWRYRLQPWFQYATQTSGGKPLTLTQTWAFAQLSYNNSANGIDNSFYPGTPGLYAVGWDDTNPTVPTAFSLYGGDSDVVVTVRLDLANPGIGGIGIVRVFDVEHSANAATANLSILIRVDNASKAPSFDNLVIYGPGDFSSQANTPTVLDRSDPYALSATFLDRLKHGCGSMRFVDSTLNFDGMSNIALPSDLRNLNDFAWGEYVNKTRATIGYVQARPWDPTVTGTVYSDLFGPPEGTPLPWSTFGNGAQLIELVTAQPHGLRTGQAPGWSGPWPTFTFTDGSTRNIGGMSRTAFVTGPNTFVTTFGGAVGPSVTLAQTYTLNPSQHVTSWNFPDNACFPPEFPAICASEFPGCDLHVNIPHAASDALADEWARRIFKYLPPDRTIYLEYSNEPWETVRLTSTF